MTKQEFYQEDFIEQYLKGTLPTPQKEAFEAALAQDSKLQETLSWQKDIIEGIREARLAELKAHLQALPTPRLSLWQQPATWIKLMGVSVVLVLIVALLMRSQLPVGHFFESELPRQASTSDEKNSESNAKTEVSEENTTKNLKESEQKRTAQEGKSIALSDKEESVQNSDASTLIVQGAPLPAESSQALPEEKSDFQFEVYYQYHDNVLQLFENIPYQLIKADLGEGEKAYLYAKDSFFELKQSSTEIFNLKDTRLNNPVHIEKLAALKK